MLEQKEDFRAERFKEPDEKTLFKIINTGLGFSELQKFSDDKYRPIKIC
jgi:hypothetical protein